MDKQTQCRKLLRYMEEFGPITTLQAITQLNIIRPASRINDLRKAGYSIDTEIVWKEHQDGSKTHYAKYTLMGDRA